MSRRSKKDLYMNTRELMISVGEATMMSKHQIPFDRHLDAGNRRYRNSMCHSSMQFRMPNVGSGNAGDRLYQSKVLRNNELSVGRLA